MESPDPFPCEKVGSEHETRWFGTATLSPECEGCQVLGVCVCVCVECRVYQDVVLCLYRGVQNQTETKGFKTGKKVRLLTFLSEYVWHVCVVMYTTARMSY